MDHYNRGNGHTTRMLREAIILVLCYKKVAVIAATDYLAHDLQKQVRGIVARLGVEAMDAWDWERIGFFGLRYYGDMRKQWEKEDVVVMADPGLADLHDRRARMLGESMPPDWPT